MHSGSRGYGASAAVTNSARARLAEFQRKWKAVQVFVVSLGSALTEAERLSGESRSPFRWPTITASRMLSIQQRHTYPEPSRLSREFLSLLPAYLVPSFRIV